MKQSNWLGFVLVVVIIALLSYLAFDGGNAIGIPGIKDTRLGADIYGNITRLNNVLAEIPKKLEYCKEQLKTLHQQMEIAKQQVDVPFEKEEELQTKSARLAELNILLNMDKHENEVLDAEPDEDMDAPEKKNVGYER
jgi:predicted RNase H-like nuclease (RuvC/YqgF family)